jgi:hypothetical protein
MILDMCTRDSAPRNRKAHEWDAIADTNSTSEGKTRVLETFSGKWEPPSTASESTSIPTDMSAVEKMPSFQGRCERPIAITVSLYS